MNKLDLSKKRLVFHGSCDRFFSVFKNENIGLGGDPNSGLGIFFAEDPFNAAEYAADSDMVVAALIPDTPSVIFDLEYQLFDDPEIISAYTSHCTNHQLPFVEHCEIDWHMHHDQYKAICDIAHKIYASRGIKTLQYSEVFSDQQCCVVLNADDIEIISYINKNDAAILSEQYYKFDDVYNQDARMNCLLKLKEHKVLDNDGHDDALLKDNNILKDKNTILKDKNTSFKM